MEKTRILLADDHPLVLTGLQAIVSRREGAEIETENTADGLLKRIESQEYFDLVVLDWQIPGCDPTTLIQAWGRLNPPVAVVVLSGISETSAAAYALDAGALGFIQKTTAEKTLLGAIERVLDGEIYLDSETALSVAQWRRQQAMPRPSLSPRQAEVLKQMATGLRNRQIADELGMAENTVKTHVSSIMNALGADNRTACIQAAREFGLLA